MEALAIYLLIGVLWAATAYYLVPRKNKKIRSGVIAVVAFWPYFIMKGINRLKGE